MSYEAIEHLCLNWHKSLLENRAKRAELLKQRDLKGFARLIDLEIGLSNIPQEKDLPVKISNYLKNFQLLDASLHGKIVFPLRDRTNKIINFLFLGDRKEEDRLVKDGGLINTKAFSVFRQLVITDNLEDFLNYFQEVKENVIPILQPEADIKEISNILKTSDVEELILLNNSPVFKYLKESIKDLGLKTFEITLPEEKTVTEYLKHHSSNKLIAFIEAEKAKVLSDRIKNSEEETERFKIEETLGEIKYIANDRTYRVRGFNKDGFEKIVQLVMEMEGKFFPDKIDLSRSQGRHKFAGITGAEFEISRDLIMEDLNQIYNHLDNLQDERFREKAGLHKEEIHIITKSEESKAIDMLASRDLLNEMLIKDTERLGHVGEDTNKKLYYLAGVSRLTEKPLSVLVIASSGSGKSFGLSTVMDLIRPEGLLKYSRITQNALYYKTEEDLKSKVLYLEELAGMENAFESIRMLLSSGYLAVSVPEKDQRTGVMRTIERRIRVNIPVISSGTRDYFDDETMSRFLLTYNDETLEHKKRILKAQAHQFSLEGEKAYLHRERILKKYRDFDSVLNPTIAVVNPFANRIMVNPNLHIVTRKQDQYLKLMYNIAFLRQHAKEKKKAEDKTGKSFDYVEVDQFDVETANEIAGHVFQFARGDLTKRQSEAFTQIENFVFEKVKDKKINPFEYKFSRREVREFTGLELTTCKRMLDELEHMEYIRKVRGRMGQTYFYSLVPFEDSENLKKDLSLLSVN